MNRSDSGSEYTAVRDESSSTHNKSSTSLSIEALHTDNPSVTSTRSQDDRNPYKVSLAEKLAAIKAARLTNDTTEIRLKSTDIITSTTSTTREHSSEQNKSIGISHQAYDF